MDKIKYNSKPFVDKLAAMIKARFSYLYITTFEEDRIIDVIRNICNSAEYMKKPRPVYTWSLTEGLIDEGGILVGADTKRPIKMLEHIAKLPSSGVFILKDFHFFFISEPMINDANIEIIRKVRDTLYYLRNGDHSKTVILFLPRPYCHSNCKKI